MKTKTKKQMRLLKRKAHMMAQFEIAVANGAVISFHNTELQIGFDATRAIKEGAIEWL